MPLATSGVSGVCAGVLLCLSSCRSHSGVWSTPSPPTSPRAWCAPPSPAHRQPSAWLCAWPTRWTSAWAWRWATGSPTTTAVHPTPSSGESLFLGYSRRGRVSLTTARVNGNARVVRRARTVQGFAGHRHGDSSAAVSWAVLRGRADIFVI